MKTKTVYVCDHCGQEYLQWQGKCDACNEWNTLKQLHNVAPLLTALKPKPLAQVSVKNQTRLASGLEELDRTLGGGIVPDSLVLISGEPGVGKSTLLLQMGAQLAAAGKLVLYVSGEESETQIKSRADRLGTLADSLVITTLNDVQALAQIGQQIKPTVMIVDSIQTLINADYPSSPGSIVQLRESALVLQHIAKRYHIAVFIVGHITKQGTIAGPKVLEHMVDTVLTFDARTDQAYRLLRVDKNRFGDTAEVGVFAMSAKGFESVKDPSSYFLRERNNAPGSCLTMVMEGKRPIILEVQALANKSVFGYPKRAASGFDSNRLQLILAILERHLKLEVAAFDVYVNIVGGLKVREPAADLAVAAAVISSISGKVLPEKLCLFGEVGLTGELRKVIFEDLRLKGIKRLGYQIQPEQKTIREFFNALNLIS